MRLLAPLALAGLLFGFFASPLHAEVRWQLDCKPGAIGTVTVDGVEGKGSYAYLTMTVSNASGREVPLSLGVWAETDVAGRKYRGTIDPVVQAAVQRKTGKEFKSLTDARAEPLADGASVEILVSLGLVDPDVDRFDVHILGLLDRVYRDQRKTWIEDRALVLHVGRPGDEYGRQYDLLKIGKTSWKTLAPRKELRRS
jgi:hypothetical protein